MHSSTGMLRLLIAAITMAAHALPAMAQSFPNRPVTLVVGFAPGGMTDIVGRILAGELSQALNQTVVVENRPGAAGQLATEYVARRRADGYTLLLSAAGHVIAPATQKTVRYHPVNDFEPIAVIASAPNMLLVNPQVPVGTVSEFVAWAKKKQSVPFGSAGVGGSSHLAGELFRHATHTPLVHVAYRGGAPAISDLIAGQIEVAFMDAVTAAGVLEAGRVKPLAIASSQRSKLFPNLPTVAESGYPGVDALSWLGLYAPAGTPSEIVGLLNTHANRIMTSPGMAKRLEKHQSEPGESLTPEQMRRFVTTEVNRWKRVVSETGVTFE